MWQEGPGFESWSSSIAQVRVTLATDTIFQTPHRARALCTNKNYWEVATQPCMCCIFIFVYICSMTWGTTIYAHFFQATPPNEPTATLANSTILHLQLYCNILFIILLSSATSTSIYILNVKRKTWIETKPNPTGSHDSRIWRYHTEGMFWPFLGLAFAEGHTKKSCDLMPVVGNMKQQDSGQNRCRNPLLTSFAWLVNTPTVLCCVACTASSKRAPYATQRMPTRPHTLQHQSE